jgi:hypothetical protein
MFDIKKHSCQLGVQRYKEFYGKPLHKDLIEQYHVPGFPGMLLSKQSRHVGQGSYAVFQHCKAAMQPSHAASKKPPKFAIANGFVIGIFIILLSR